MFFSIRNKNTLFSPSIEVERNILGSKRAEAEECKADRLLRESEEQRLFNFRDAKLRRLISRFVSDPSNYSGLDMGTWICQLYQMTSPGSKPPIRGPEESGGPHEKVKQTKH